MGINQFQSHHLRPVDPLRDMPTILDLIEMGFKQELDPQGWKMLNQMRSMTRQTGLMGMRSALRSESAGFVWEEDGNVVANLSLRTAFPSFTRGRLIGNVVVHPDYRGRGIGHALLEAAVNAARNEGARWIGLEVRQQNIVACRLYRHFGFHDVGSIYHLLRSADLPWPEDISLNAAWRKSKPMDKTQWTSLADTVYGHYQKRVLEIRDYQFAFGGFKRWVHISLNGQRESAWISDNTRPRFAVCLKTDHRYRFHEWNMLLHSEEGDSGAEEVVAKALSLTRHYPPWAVIALVAEQKPLVDRLLSVDFHIHRTLVQMLLEI